MKCPYCLQSYKYKHSIVIHVLEHHVTNQSHQSRSANENAIDKQIVLKQLELDLKNYNEPGRFRPERAFSVITKNPFI